MEHKQSYNPCTDGHICKIEYRSEELKLFPSPNRKPSWEMSVTDNGEVKNMQLMFESDIKEKRIRINSLMGRNAMTDFDIDTTYFLNSYEALVFDSTLFYTALS